MTESATWTRVDDGRFQVDLLTADYRRHAFTRHSHATFAIGVVVCGVEQFRYRGELHRAGVGSLAILEPGEPHDGQAAGPAGWAYRVFYPPADMLFDSGTGPAHFADAIVHDPRSVHLVRSAHEELTAGADPLAGHSKLTWALAAVVRRHGSHAGDPSVLSPRDAAAVRKVAQVRDRLMADLRCAPGLRELAAGVELSPFHMLRVFRDVTGFPPHTWLVLERVCRARQLLAAGVAPAQVASGVGFADQAHLTRWFKRVTGVTPAAFRNAVQDPVRTPA
ncbi:AraC family transcriptional regulator [Dactylosporangium aurantiacum]|uniref:AraC family transcriptional regulator n=1 Tax=Dactylosporangium aurantiacum TaxID=35754 RepID=A0A9Q9ING0_9ACTN|nr:AraC family transcriptional regulator [Dactylosporangium aurantiacum]MDG6108971.1 AraC family transcriptional regulator [Dactylosporangium aurantiacum]UWZ56524.1 AraC family transcriptional regulator [Dactylosporangium aurantiacum]